jgi:cobalt/nickel transport system permease protein
VAVHVADGFFDAATSAGAVAVSAGVLAVAARRSSAELEERQAPLAGLVAAFVFAAQMVNVPVAAGTSGHLLGGALAAILVGPWAGVLCVAVVLVVPLLFADGGVTAIGIDVLLLGIVPALAGAPLFAALRRALPATRRGVAGAAGVAAGLTVPLAALAFTGLSALGAPPRSRSGRWPAPCSASTP